MAEVKESAKKKLEANQDLIDDFMGREHWRMAPGNYWYSYHNDWNYLMGVVEFIHKPEIKKGKILRESADVYINYRNCVIEYVDDDLSYDLHPEGISGKTKIEAVYKAVVAFITWWKSFNK